MPNSQLTNKAYQIPQQFQKSLGKTMSYSALNMMKSRLSKAKTNDTDKFNEMGGDAVLRWSEQTLKNDTNAIHSVKKTGMDAGRENEFIETHEKDNANANPTKSDGGLPKITKGKVFRKIMTNKEVYNESINKEIKEIRYLIEYITNNKLNL